MGTNDNIWQAAQAISAGYKNASSDYLSHEWVLGILVRHLTGWQQKAFAKKVAAKLQGKQGKEVEKILLQAFAQLAPLVGRKI